MPAYLLLSPDMPNEAYIRSIADSEEEAERMLSQPLVLEPYAPAFDNGEALEASNKQPAVAAEEAPKVRAFPNPSSTHVTIVLPPGQSMESMVVLDARGRIVRRYTTATDLAKPVVDVSGFEPGYYLVHLRSKLEDGTLAWHTERIARL